MNTKKRKKIKSGIIAINSNVVFEHHVSVVTEGCIYFFNAKHLFLKLTTIERAYFDYICERMTNENLIKLNPQFRRDFIGFCNNIMSDEEFCGERTLFNAEKKFSVLQLVFKIEGDKISLVNPKYVFNGSQASRDDVLNNAIDLANKGKIPKEAIIDTPYNQLKPDAKLLSELNELMWDYPEGYEPGIVIE